MRGWSFPMQEQSVAPQWAMSILSVSLASFVKWNLYLVLVKRTKSKKKISSWIYISLFFSEWLFRLQAGCPGLLSPGQPALDGK